MPYSDRLVLVSLNSKYIQSNTAVYYLHEILQKEGMESDVLSHSINEDFHDILASILKSSPTIVCFSCYIWNISLVRELCSAIRTLDAGIRIMLGGPEVSFEPSEAMEKSGAHLIVRGEGETVIAEAVRGIKDGVYKAIPGLYYFDGENAVDTGYAVTEKLSAIPFPFTPYMMERERGKLLYYESSRGCPFNCIYCLSSATKGVRYLDMERVMAEILKIIEYEPKVIKFTDRSFNSNPARAVELLEFIGRLDTRTCFHLEIYPGMMNEEMILALSQMPAGRVQIEAGIQSTDVNVLEFSGRPQDSAAALYNLGRIMEMGNIHVHIDLIAGLPGDSIESFSKSFNATISVLPHKLQMGFLKLLKGTRARDIKGYRYTQGPPYEVLASDAMDYHEIQELRSVSRFLETFYNSGHFTEYFKYILSKSDDIFKTFRELSQQYEKFIPSGAGVSRDGKYLMLSQYSRNDPMALDILGYDYLSSFRTKVLPPFLGGKILGKEESFDILRSIVDGNPRELYKTCTIAVFSLFEKSTCLFDYSAMDEVTGIFRVVKIST